MISSIRAGRGPAPVPGVEQLACQIEHVPISAQLGVLLHDLRRPLAGCCPRCRQRLPAESARSRELRAARIRRARREPGMSLAARPSVGKREPMGPLERDRLEQLFEALYERAIALEGRPSLTLAEWLRHAECWRIRLALEHCGGDRTAAARRLGVPRRSLYYRMQQVGVS